MSAVAKKTDKQLEAHLVRMDAVVSEYLKGATVSQIAQSTGMSTATVGTLLREWRQLASNNEGIKARAKSALIGFDEHYNKLIKKAYEVMEDAEQAESLNQRMAAIKAIADMEAKRIDMLQKAGLLEENDVGKKIVETERKQEVLMKILREVVGPCPHCRPRVQERLAEVTEGVVIINAEASDG